MKNIVICCDGTRGKYDAEYKNTNVVRLFERLCPDGKGKGGEREQISYYDPGVGTYSPQRSRIRNWVAKRKGDISGRGVRANVEDAYKYLMDCYEPKDQIFLFGYSRGAYTVRALAGMLHKCGLLTKGSNHLVSYASEIYRGRDNVEMAAGFKRNFCRQCKPYFIGVWDTVASLGWVRREHFQDQRLNGDVTYGFQVLSIDERRKHFQVSEWDERTVPVGQTITQVWFPGSHADVGGQEADPRVSDITLEWMLRHADEEGLRLRADWRDSLHPDPAGTIRPNKWYWHLLGGMEDRTIRKDAKVHESAILRRDNSDNHYRPKNLPESYVKVE